MSYPKSFGSRGRTRCRHRMRCSSCRHRFTLKRHPDKYKRPPECPSCGSGSAYSCEAARQRELRKQDTCYCHACPFPHRKGSIRLCQHYPVHPDDWTEEDFERAQATLATPRGGTT